VIFSQLAYCLCEHGIHVLRRTPNEIPFDRCMFPVHPSQTLSCLFFRVDRYLCRLKHLVAHACIYRVFQKSTPPLKLLGIFSLRLYFFAWNFADLLRSICWQFISTHMYQCLQIYLNISSNGVNFSTSTHCFHPVKFWVGLFTQKMQMQLFGNDVIFSSSRVLVSDNCKQSISVRFLLTN